MSQASMGKRVMVGKPPDKGSFPLDHFNECSALKAEYLQCLKEHSFDNMSCRYLSKKYLECRMDHNLMRRESMNSLGFLEEENAAKPARKRDKAKKEDAGWVVGVDGIQPDRRERWQGPTLFNPMHLFGSGSSGAGSAASPK
eukprot:TRINITY_DN63235_c0_g1_i1.p2 TRINITY_DN63235_c0_g1~~TRINITY_DN63235_c0_g1_i1.p2  ORF type:complete len:142 (+),score=38.78 TRINITY_DN63235_c0_g1_i1:94-519(+)